MDENLVSKQSKEAQENIKKLNDIFKEKNREDIVTGKQIGRAHV